MSKTLYVIHGWAYSVAPWQATIDTLKQRDIDVVMLSVPGLTAPSDKVWTISGYVDWLDEQLAGIDQPLVLGHSNGGRIAMHYLAAHPNRFERLILLASAGIEVESKRLSKKRQVFRVLSKIFAVLKHVPYLRKIVYRLLGSDYNDAPDNMKQTLANMLASDKDFDPSGILTPTYLLYGTNDTTTTPALAEKLQKLLPKPQLRIMDDWGHAPYRTHPTELADAIADYLESPT